MQEVVRDFPPYYLKITNTFPAVIGRPVIFSWGDLLYNPSGVTLTPALLAHEGAHGRRQIADVRGWWDQYLEDESFRLSEELIGHHAEYRAIVGTGNRNQRRAAMKLVASKLASPIYGPMVSKSAARDLLLGGVVQF